MDCSMCHSFFSITTMFDIFFYFLALSFIFHFRFIITLCVLSFHSFESKLCYFLQKDKKDEIVIYEFVTIYRNKKRTIHLVDYTNPRVTIMYCGSGYQYHIFISECRIDNAKNHVWLYNFFIWH